MKFKALATAVALTASVPMAGPAFAASLLLDDFQFAVSAVAEDTSADGTGVTTSPRGTGGQVGTGFARDSIYANLVSGFSAATYDDSVFPAGFFSTAQGNGHGYWRWTATGLDLTAWDRLDLEYRADLLGADLILSFWSNGGSTLIGYVQSKDLAASTGSTYAPTSFGLAALTLTNVTAVRLDVFSNGSSYTDPNGLGTLALGTEIDDLDFLIRNAVFNSNGTAPEPGTLALLGLGLAGLAASRRRMQ
jgi:hypothetical protein